MNLARTKKNEFYDNLLMCIDKICRYETSCTGQYGRIQEAFIATKEAIQNKMNLLA